MQDEVKGTGENYIIRTSVICRLCQIGKSNSTHHMERKKLHTGCLGGKPEGQIPCYMKLEIKATKNYVRPQSECISVWLQAEQ